MFSNSSYSPNFSLPTMSIMLSAISDSFEIRSSSIALVTSLLLKYNFSIIDSIISPLFQLFICIYIILSYLYNTFFTFIRQYIFYFFLYICYTVYKYYRGENMDKTRINTTINTVLWKEIKKYAIDKDMNVNEVLEKLIADFLEQEQGKK